MSNSPAKLPDISPLVSVLIPSYNHSKYIVSALESVASETYPNIDLVILDDGSTDDSYQIARSWLSTNSSKFSSSSLSCQVNSGIATTLNRLICMAKGKYVAFLASDDILLPGGIRTRVNRLESDSKLLAVFGDCISIDEHGEIIHESTLVDRYMADKVSLGHSETIKAELIWRWSIPGPVLMVRRNTFFDSDGIGLYPDGLSVEDRYFYLNALSKDGLAFVDSLVSGYRLHSSQSIITIGDRISLDIAKIELSFINKFSGPSSIALLLRSLELYVTNDNIMSKILRSILWHLRRALGRMVLHANSSYARRLARSAQRPG